jgi:hypothetical protein
MNSPTLNDDRGELLAAVDLAELFATEGFPQGRNRQWPCPVHDGQTGASPPVSLYLSDSPPRWYCHSCWEHGTALDLIVATRNVTVGEAFGVLREMTGRRRRRELSPGRRLAPKPRALPTPAPAKEPTADDTTPATGPRADALMGTYLERRQWPADLATEAGLSVVTHPRRGDAVRHPFTINGRCLGWQDRTLSTAPDDKKWMTPKGSVLIPHGIDQLEYLTERPQGTLRLAILTEGPADALTVRAHWAEAIVIGCPGVNNWNRRGSVLLAAAKISLVLIAFDNDDPGTRGAVKVEHELRQYRIDTRRVPIPDQYNDLSDWATDVGTGFVPAFTQALRDCASAFPGEPSLLAPLLGDRREVKR